MAQWLVHVLVGASAMAAGVMNLVIGTNKLTYQETVGKDLILFSAWTHSEVHEAEERLEKKIQSLQKQDE